MQDHVTHDACVLAVNDAQSAGCFLFGPNGLRVHNVVYIILCTYWSLYHIHVFIMVPKFDHGSRNAP